MVSGSARARAAALLAFALVAAPATAARAQGSSEAAATALFDEGRRLMAEHRWAEACPKLAESERLAPSGGTLLNLADCYEHTGQTASAWAAWKDVASRANAAGKADVEKRALAKAAALEPTLAKLTIAVDAASDVAGLDVKRDGVGVGHAEFGTAIPVDPGAHVVEAAAPKKKTFTAKVDVAPRQTDAKVTIALEDEPQSAAPAPAAALPPVGPTAPPAPEQPRAASGGGGLKVAGLVTGAVGVLGLGAGAVFGFIAKSKNDQALEPQNCRTSTLCTQAGLSLTDDAKRAATLSTVSFVAGGVLVAGGLTLWLTAPSAERSAGVRLAPVVAQSYGGLALDGAF